VRNDFEALATTDVLSVERLSVVVIHPAEILTCTSLPGTAIRRRHT
jgi:energy-converting hydrogenase Eha subunit G